jgi:hypothetical protein
MQSGEQELAGSSRQRDGQLQEGWPGRRKRTRRAELVVATAGGANWTMGGSRCETLGSDDGRRQRGARSKAGASERRRVKMADSDSVGQ